MIICRTPFRVSFFGGGTDYPSWYRTHGGAVLAATIDKYCYLSCRYLPPFFEHRFRVVYSKIEDCLTRDEIEHPAVRAVLNYLGLTRGVEIHHDGDLPARSGMGSSSAFTVGLLHALHALKGEMISRRQLAVEAIHIEQEVLRETVGCQDQILAAYGGFCHIVFLPDGTFTVRPVTLPCARLQELNDHLMLFYTGIRRTASVIAESYMNDVEERRRQLRIMKDLVEEGLTALGGGGSLLAFGELLHEAWVAKRSLGPMVSNPYVDELYAEARAAGAIGGKLTGAGGGGFLLLFVPPGARAAVRQRLGRLIHVPFGVASVGSQIVFYDQENDYAEEHAMRDRQQVEPFREAIASTRSG
jgi:D-glycero-alpha-D-manno-heptose-7-phosphate kinase